MEYRRLGKSGLKISALSFGSWVTFGTQIDTGKAAEMMTAAYDGGVNFFDNAEGYAAGRSEVIMGAAIKKLGWRRDSFCVSSKVFFGCVEKPSPIQKGLCRKHVFEACHQAMERLHVDYLDLYFCHRADPDTPIEETVRAMHDLIQQGKVLYWGTSEWSAQQIMEAHAVARQYNLTPPTMEQPCYNMFSRERVETEYARLYDTVGLGTTVWSPLASGVLTGKYNAGIPQDSRMNVKGFEWLKENVTSDWGKERLVKVRTLTARAGDLGCSMAQLALAWCLKNPHVSALILGASRASQLQENFGALDVVDKLDDGVMAEIERILAS